MEPSGIRRKIDDLGRVVIPSQIRRTLGLTEGDELDVALEGERVVLSKPGSRCAFCDGTEHLTTFRGRAVCWSCTAALRALDRERHGDAAPRRSL